MEKKNFMEERANNPKWISRKSLTFQQKCDIIRNKAIPTGGSHSRKVKNE